MFVLKSVAILIFTLVLSPRLFAECNQTPRTQCDGWGPSSYKDVNNGMFICQTPNYCYTASVTSRICRYYDSCGNLASRYQEDKELSAQGSCHPCSTNP